MKVVDEIAAVFWFLEDYAMGVLEDGGKYAEYFPEYKDFDTAKQHYLRFVAALEDEPFADGKHCGDCTKVPMTCVRCVVEDYRKQAQEWLATFTDKDVVEAE